MSERAVVVGLFVASIFGSHAIAQGEQHSVPAFGLEQCVRVGLGMEPWHYIAATVQASSTPLCDSAKVGEETQCSTEVTVVRVMAAGSRLSVRKGSRFRTNGSAPLGSKGLVFAVQERENDPIYLTTCLIGDTSPETEERFISALAAAGLAAAR